MGPRTPKHILANPQGSADHTLEKQCFRGNLLSQTVMLRLLKKFQPNRLTFCEGLYRNISFMSRYHLTECSFCSSIRKWQLSSAARRGSAMRGTCSWVISCADVTAVDNDKHILVKEMLAKLAMEP